MRLTEHLTVELSCFLRALLNQSSDVLSDAPDTPVFCVLSFPSKKKKKPSNFKTHKRSGCSLAGAHWTDNLIVTPLPSLNPRT